LPCCWSPAWWCVLGWCSSTLTRIWSPAGWWCGHGAKVSQSRAETWSLPAFKSREPAFKSREPAFKSQELAFKSRDACTQPGGFSRLSLVPSFFYVLLFKGNKNIET
jgi:hypothetical protein